jgi:hypothetical protein
MTIHKIGTQVYGVHKKYVDDNLKNGKIIVGKVRTYENIDGKVQAIIKEVGAPRMIDTRMYYIYTDLEVAVKAITTTKKKC